MPVEEIIAGISYGVRKVNIDTDLRMASIGAMRQYLAQKKHAANIDPRKLYQASTAAMQAICQARYEALGSAGHAGHIKPLALTDMLAQYKRA